MEAIGGRERGAPGRPTGVSQAHRQSIRLPGFGAAVIVQVMQQLGLMLVPSARAQNRASNQVSILSIPSYTRTKSREF